MPLTSQCSQRCACQVPADDPGRQLATFAGQPHAAFLWFEYWIDAGRRGSLDVADHMLGKVHTLLLDLLGDLQFEDPDETAHALLSWLLGTIIQQHVRPRTSEMLRCELTQLLQIHSPS